MLEPFYYMLRSHGLKVSPTEWLALQRALGEDLAGSSLTSFYYLSRALLVKSEQQFDLYDRLFAEFFRDFETSEEMLSTILAGMKDADILNLSPEELAKLPALDLEALRERFRKKYEEGHYDQHVGGNQQIGTGGRSPTGDMGDNPQGLRVGQREEGRNRRAIQVATQRRFKDLSGTQVLDTRQIQAALKRLKVLTAEGPEDQLNLESTIDASARNAGEIDLVFEAERRNRVKILLLIDIGGSMDPHARVVDLLFSAARGMFREVKYYYFHNCIYQELWESFSRGVRVPTTKVLRDADPNSKVIVVGDAAMALSELLAKDGAIDYFYRNDVPGLRWLEQVRERFKHIVWLNPDPVRFWNASDSVRYVRRLFPMHEFTLEGLEDAARELMRKV